MVLDSCAPRSGSGNDAEPHESTARRIEAASPSRRTAPATARFTATPPMAVVRPRSPMDWDPTEAANAPTTIHNSWTIPDRLRRGGTVPPPAAFLLGRIQGALPARQGAHRSIHDCRTKTSHNS